MTVSEIITRGKIREDFLWSPFSHDPFSGNKVELFGLYANTYLYGYTYLEDISGEKLIQIITEYDSNIARLDAEEQVLVIENTAKRYADMVEGQIHKQKMNTRQKEIDATNDEYDAKFFALEEDQLAILTKKEQLSLDIEKANAEIEELKAKIKEESLKQNYVAVDIAETKTKIVQRNLQVLEAGIRGIELQYEIVKTAVEQVDIELENSQTQQKINLVPGEKKEIEASTQNVEADIIRTNANKAMVDAEIGKIEAETEKIKISVDSKDIDTNLLEVDIAKADVDVSMTDVQIKETKTKKAREDVKQIELQNDIAMVDVQLAQIQLDIDKVNVQLKEIEADVIVLDAKMLRKNIANIDQQIASIKKSNLSFEIPGRKNAQIEAICKQMDILNEKIAAEQHYCGLEAQKHNSRIDKAQSEHDYKMTITKLDNALDQHRAQVKIDSYAKDLTFEGIADGLQVEEDTERIKIQASQIIAAKKARRAAENAAKTMASADIINTLTHEIGST